MIVLNHTTRVDEPRTTLIRGDDPMYGVIEGMVRSKQFTKADWEVVWGADLLIRHFHRGFGNSRYTVQLWEMEIAGILHCIQPTNILQSKLQQELRSALGEESHVFKWVGWEIVALMAAMSEGTKYLRDIKSYFRNSVGRDLESMYWNLMDTAGA